MTASTAKPSAAEAPAADTGRAANEPEVSPAGRPSRPWLRRSLLIIGPLLVALVAGFFYITGGRYVSTENAYIKADKVRISANVSGPIDAVAIAENQPVKKGEILFRIDPAPFQTELARAEAHLADVRADVESARAAYRQKQHELALAQSDTAYAQREYQRQARLAKRQAVSESTLDEKSHDLDTAKQRSAVIRAALAQLKAQLGGDPDLPVEQQPRYQEARAARDQAALDLEHTRVRAPFTGVARNTPEPGQYAGAGEAVMALVADRGMWIDANFKETELTHVRPGQEVTISVDTYPGREWHGRVKSISQATDAEFSLLPAQNSTGNWVKVVQRIPVRIVLADEPNAPPLRAGMSTEVEIDTRYHRGLPDWLNPFGATASAASGN